MKTAVVYYSEHHGNTKKLLDAIAAKHDVTLINVTKTPETDLSGYDRIGLASGIYYSSFAKQLLAWAETHLPEGKDVFFIHTAGDPRESHADSAKHIAAKRSCRCLGVYYCKGFDTFGPFKLIGGINKHHPDEDEIKQAVRFYERLEK